MNDQSKTKRRWLSFGLKSLLFFTFIIALAFGWIKWQLNEGQKHKALADQLTELGCYVELSYFELVRIKSPYGQQFFMATTLSPWVESLGLTDYYRRIDRVQIYSRDKEKQEEAIQHIIDLGQIRKIQFLTKIGNEEYANRLLANLKVEALDLPYADLPRTTIPCLNHPTLQELTVKNTQFSNPAIDSLPALLVFLDASRTRINDEGLAKFVRLKKLKRLKLNRTPTTKAAVEELRQQMPWCKIEWAELKQS